MRGPTQILHSPCHQLVPNLQSNKYSPHHCQPHRRHQPRVRPQTITRLISLPVNVLLPTSRHQNQPKKIENAKLARNVPSWHVLGVRRQATAETSVEIVEKHVAEGGTQKSCTRHVAKGGILSGVYFCTSNHLTSNHDN